MGGAYPSYENLNLWQNAQAQYQALGQYNHSIGHETQAIGLGYQRITGEQVMQQMADMARARYEAASKPAIDYLRITREVSA